jgi:septation ring formation regulator EzrA
MFIIFVGIVDIVVVSIIIIVAVCYRRNKRRKKIDDGENRDGDDESLDGSYSEEIQ